jgi:hypothetical protein
MFSIEFALHGASTTGVEIRETNIKKAIFCKEVLGLDNLSFRQDDVRNISLEAYGKFDAIICSGILYHLPAADAIKLIKNMYELVNRVVVIDTFVSRLPEERCLYEANEYWGDTFQEHPADATPAEKLQRRGSSADNATSFWFTRPSLLNLLNQTGFSSVYECFIPMHLIPENLNFEQAGIKAQDRCTFVALKSNACESITSPNANDLQQDWPELRN